MLAVAACPPQVDVVPRVLAPDPTVGPCDGITVAVYGRGLAGTGDGGDAEPTATCVRTDQTLTAQVALSTADITATTTSSDDYARWVVWTQQSGGTDWTDAGQDLTTLEWSPATRWHSPSPTAARRRGPASERSAL